MPLDTSALTAFLRYVTSSPILSYSDLLSLLSVCIALKLCFQKIYRRLRHYDDETTKAIYIHITQKMKQKDNEAVDTISIIN